MKTFINTLNLTENINKFKNVSSFKFYPTNNIDIEYTFIKGHSTYFCVFLPFIEKINLNNLYNDLSNLLKTDSPNLPTIEIN